MIGKAAMSPYMQPNIVALKKRLMAISGSLNMRRVLIGFGHRIFDFDEFVTDEGCPFSLNN